jgi:hypothetical protein
MKVVEARELLQGFFWLPGGGGMLQGLQDRWRHGALLLYPGTAACIQSQLHSSEPTAHGWHLQFAALNDVLNVILMHSMHTTDSIILPLLLLDVVASPASFSVALLPPPTPARPRTPLHALLDHLSLTAAPAGKHPH